MGTRRGDRFFDFTATEALIAGVVTALVQVYAAFVFGIAAESDFAIFLRTTERFVDGARMYSPDAIDFTPPLFHVLLLPLVHLDVRIGFVIWTAANVAAGWVVFTAIVRRIPGAWTRRRVVAAWVLNAAAVQMTVRLGQVSWLVALLVTYAWLAARSSRAAAAGFWAGVALAFKPFLLVIVPVFLVRRQWKSLAVCAATAVACCGVGVLAFGAAALSDWMRNLRAVPDPTYATHFLNVSWVGIVARAGAPQVLATALSVATIAAMLWRARTADEDEAWLLLMIAAILASPVGWVYYEAMLLGPAVALVLSGRLEQVRWAALTVIVPALSRNMFQRGSAIVAVTLGSIYFWGLFVVFGRLLFRPAVHRDLRVQSAKAA